MSGLAWLEALWRRIGRGVAPLDQAGGGALVPFVWATVIACVLGGALAVMTYGTNDVLFYKSHAAKLAASGVESLYLEGSPLVEHHTDRSEEMVHPPAGLHIWAAMLWMEEHTGVPFQTWFRFLTILANALTGVALYRLLGGRAAILFVLCPATIMLGAFHGNTDPLMATLLVWAVYCVERGRGAWLAGLLFAAACCFKVWPLFLVPAFGLAFPAWRQRAAFAASALGGTMVFCAPFLYQQPVLIARKVFGYRSTGGWWGLAGMWTEYSDFGMPIAFAAVLAMTIYLVWRGVDVYDLVGGAITVFLVFTPGFGVNYYAWVLPFALRRGWRSAVGPFWTSSVFLGVTYTQWCDGIPWYFADTILRGGISSWPFTYAATLAWLFLVLAVIGRTPLQEVLFPVRRAAGKRPLMTAAVDSPKDGILPV